LFFLAELVFAGSMILGLAVRFVGVLAVAYSLRLWLGLCDNPSGWPWTYMFLAMLMLLFALEGAGWPRAVFSNEQTFSPHLGMSQTCHKETYR
jgi:hypothetical protein